jgi:hypothetical protein
LDAKWRCIHGGAGFSPLSSVSGPALLLLVVADGCMKSEPGKRFASKRHFVRLRAIFPRHIRCNKRTLWFSATISLAT